MGTTIITGAVIGGAPKGYPTYTKTIDGRPLSGVRRKKPLSAEALLSNPTSWIAYRTQTEHSPAFDNGVLIPPILHTIGDANLNAIMPLEVQQRLREQTIQKALVKIKDEKFNLGTFLGELPESQRHFKKTLKDVVDLYRSVKKGDLKKLKILAKRGRAFVKRRGIMVPVQRVTKSVSQRWLEWRYAICPWVYTLDDSLSYLHRSAMKPSISRIGSGGREFHNELTSEKYPLYTITRSTQGEAQGRVVAYFRVNIQAEAFKQLGLLNPAAVLWELTPLSFVVDWFLPVGDFIGHLDAMAGVSVLSATYSIAYKGTISQPNVSYYDKRVNGVVYTGSFGNHRSQIDGYHRVPISLSKPSFKFGSSPTGKQLIDLVTLTRNLGFR